MFKIGIQTKDKDLIEFLEVEATLINDTEFSFSSSERAVSVLAQFLYHTIKKETLHRIIPESETSSNEIDSFLLFVPYEFEETFKVDIRERIRQFIIQEDAAEFFVEGFLTFRIHDFKEDFYQFFLDEYTHFLEATEPSESLETLINYMNSQPNHASEVVIVTYENGDIALKENNQCIYLEQDNSQENIIVQSVFASPNKVTVVDNYNVLKKESIIVLTQLFGKNLFFV